MTNPAISLQPQAATPPPAERAAVLASSRTLPTVLATALALVLILADFATPHGLNVAVVYSLPLVFAAAARRPPMLWGLAVSLVAATFAVYAVQAQLSVGDARLALLQWQDVWLLDRALAALTVLLTAAILQGWLIALHTIELRDRAIAENAARLQRANAELLQQREEITRQNAELERRRHEAEALSRRKTQMLAAISHDIRTPIHSISLMAEIMRRSAQVPAPDVRLPAIAQRLQSHALTVAELLSEVIDLASFDAGRVALHCSRFDLRELLRDQAQRLAPLAEEKGLRLEVDADGAPLLLHTDKVKLGRILGNLVSNAAKFTDAGTITLRCAADPAQGVRISVSDTGRGIAAGSLESIFGDYCQEDGAAVQSGSGWGLGLAICRRLAALLEGELLVESAPGRGSTFTLVLPPTALAPAS